MTQTSGRFVLITPTVQIPRRELRFAYSRSSGPGGQNVNKVSSKATLRFDVLASAALSDVQKQRIVKMLRQRIDQHGVLHLSCDTYRTQARNKKECIDRFVRLLEGALRVRATRVATKPSVASARRRLEEKARRATIKGQRFRTSQSDE